MSVHRILILSRNPELYSTRSLFEAGRRRGHFVRIADHLHFDLFIEGRDTNVYLYGEPLQRYDAIIPRIGSTATHQGASVIRHFEAMGIYTTLKADALLRARDKLSCLQILVQDGIPVPKTMLVSNLDSMESMISKINEYPKIIKILSGTHGIGVIKADSRDVMQTMMETFYNLQQKAIIQEYIKESNGSDIRVFVVNGVVVATMERTAAEGDFRSNLHRGGSAKLVDITDYERKIALRSVEILGLEVAGVDMLRSNAGPVILEVNASPGLEGIETTTRIDISKTVMEMIEQRLYERAKR